MNRVESRLEDKTGSVLAELARQSVAFSLGCGPEPHLPTDRGPLAATFVTIRKHGELRGCIGTTCAEQPLFEDVQARARAAAFRDPRFPAVAPDELEELVFEVSVLSTPEPIILKSFGDACKTVRPGVDGVYVRALGRSGLLLPQVWESLPAPEDFLDMVWRKAALPRRHWDEDLEFLVFTVEKYTEEHGAEEHGAEEHGAEKLSLGEHGADR